MAALNLYTNDEDRHNLARLHKLFAKRGLVFVDKKGNPSASALFRYLVSEKLRELTAQPLYPGQDGYETTT